MVKADVKRDYYADLSLSPNAETEAIKKQFRKLGEIIFPLHTNMVVSQLER